MSARTAEVALAELAAQVDTQLRLLDARLPAAAPWRGLLRREVGGRRFPEERARVTAAYDALVREPVPVTTPDALIALHAVVVGAGRGVGFRVSRRRVGPPGSGSAPCADPADVPGLTGFALARATSASEPPLLVAARLHLDLALAHPFEDGNGRVARLAAASVLLAAGYRSTLAAAVEQHARGDAEGYRMSFQRLASDGDENAWLASWLARAARRSSAVVRFRMRESLLRRTLAGAGVTDEAEQSEVLLAFDEGRALPDGAAHAEPALLIQTPRWPALEPNWGEEALRLPVQLQRLRSEERDVRTVVDPAAEAAPVASVIVPTYRGAETIAAVLRGLAAQDLAEQHEVIVVASAGDSTADIVRRSFPWAALLVADGRLTPGAARNAGIDAARADIVAFLADDCIPDPDWLRRRVEAHRAGHLLVGGFVDSAEPSTVAGWAQYFAKFWGLQRLRGTRSEGTGPLFHLSYDRRLLAARFDETVVAGEDTALNHALVAAGHRILFDGAIRVRHLNDRRFAEVLAAQREQGAAGAEACRKHGLGAVYLPGARGGPWMPVVLWWRAARAVARHRPELLGRFTLASPLVVAAAFARRRAIRRALGAPLPSDPRRPAIRAVPEPPRRPLVTAVVPAYNEEAAIGDCLDSLLAQTVDALEIIVADDGSTDRTAAVAGTRGVRVVSVPHGGPAAAKNAGVAVAAGDVVAFVDADLILERDCLERLCRPILDGTSTGTFTRDIRVANPENPWADCWTHNRRARRGEHFGPAAVPDRWANFRAVSRTSFLAAGGFDDVGYGEDMTLAPKLGRLAEVVPGAVMWHRHPDSLGEIWENARWVGRGAHLRGLPRVARRYGLLRSIRRGIRGACAIGRPRYVLFALVYDFGVLTSYLETRLGRSRHAK